ncbi:hypothetical protein WZ342_1297 [Enterococcus faecalis]|nr:hypothetical protein WZ342_1297 [Enterococcus faecalis]DAL85763.1 MAG TPA: hypothetical protein [Caudoviricetes sp.]
MVVQRYVPIIIHPSFPPNKKRSHQGNLFYSSFLFVIILLGSNSFYF